MFFLPLFDDNPPGRRPIVNWLIIAACVLVFLYQMTLPVYGHNVFMLEYGALPLLISHGENTAALVTSAFLHGGWLHLGGNMLYLWIFGDNVEDRMGPFRFLLFYTLCAVVATLSHVAIDPGSTTPLVGASGAIAGVLAAYLILFPRAKVRVLIIIIVFLRWIYIPAFVVLLGWLLMQVLAAPFSISSQGGVAYFAHIGGFVAGLVLTPLLARRKPAGDIIASPGMDNVTREAEDHSIRTASTRQVRNEFAQRYRYRKRTTGVPNVKRRGQSPGDDPPKGSLE